jgi:Protein of unknown function (DUF3455)
MLRNSNHRATYLISTFVCAFVATACGGSQEGSPEALGAVGAAALSTECARAPLTLPSPTLAVPAGNVPEFFYDAKGVQIYACLSTATGFGWVFQAPEATLFDRRGRIAGKHYAGPTWAANDGSTVVGSKIASFAPDPTSIPWLLLAAASHTGAGRMSSVSYVQRLETTGGTAPATGCDGAHVGDTARVDYTATYFFYEARD